MLLGVLAWRKRLHLKAAGRFEAKVNMRGDKSHAAIGAMGVYGGSKARRGFRVERNRWLI